MRFFSALITLFLLSTSMHLFAAGVEGLDVSPLIIDLSQQQHTAEIFVRNSGNETAYAHVDLYQYHHAGLTQQKLSRIRDIRKSNLLVTPSRFILKPKQQRVLRVRLRNTSIKQDDIYSVDIREATRKPKLDDVYGKPEMLMQMLVGFNVLVIHHRTHGKARVTIKRHGKKITLTNSGNTTARVLGQDLCQDGQCVSSIATMLTPGQTRTLQLAKALAGKYTVEWPQHKYVVTSN